MVEVIPAALANSNLDEEPIKNGLINKGASPEIISKNLAEIKAVQAESKITFFRKPQRPEFLYRFDDVANYV